MHFPAEASLLLGVHGKACAAGEITAAMKSLLLARGWLAQPINRFVPRQHLCEVWTAATVGS